MLWGPLQIRISKGRPFEAGRFLTRSQECPSRATCARCKHLQAFSSCGFSAHNASPEGWLSPGINSLGGLLAPTFRNLVMDEYDEGLDDAGGHRILHRGGFKLSRDDCDYLVGRCFWKVEKDEPSAIEFEFDVFS